MFYMTPIIAKSLRPLALLFFASSFHAYAQYSLDWFKLSGGGGTSTGSVYSITGTIGQHDSNSSMSGGNYSLTGGFWSLIGTVQTPGAPLLSVSVTISNSVLVSWPFPSTGFSLEQNGALGSPNWVAATATPIQVGSQWQALIPSPVGNAFYRLHAH
jgi:hypothetical protein